ncbi:host specificity factor TipJ family phage tail protein [Vreelandella venusta]|uniref:host specificity factor TipJ family phage tail protein n=1 Tax=Vreelandella venusta TaxID=44935 RepID=UPI003557F10C
MSEIRIYPSVIRTVEGAPTQPLKTHQVESGTLTDWLLANVPSYADNPDYNPWEVEVDGARGVIVDPADYTSVQLSGNAVVHLYISPQGGAISSVFDAVVDVFSSVFSWLMPDIPTPNANGQIDQGSQINDPSVTVNRPKLNGVINQIAGQVKLAPYYLAPPHSYFINPRTKALDILLCVTWGQCLLPASQIRIGETPIGALGNDVQWQAFMPGETISGHPAHELWYTAPEVGAAGNGQAGLKLKATLGVTPALFASFIDVNVSTITVPDSEPIPTDWTVGLQLNVLIDRQLQISPPAPETERARIGGAFGDLGLSVGDSVLITGSTLAGEYVVHGVSSTEITLSYPDLTPVTAPTSGTLTATIDRLGARYVIAAIDGLNITVEKRLANGSPDNTWQGWAPITLTQNWAVKVDRIDTEGDWLGPFNAQKSGTLINRIQAVVFMPQGLGFGESGGDVSERTLNIELHWRELGTSSWVSETLTMTDATRDQLGFTIDVTLPQPMAVECRLRRLEPEDEDVRAFDEMQWTQLSSRLSVSPTHYDDITVLAMTIIGSDAIAGQSENCITCVPTMILPTMEGDIQPTRAIIDWVRNAANQSGISDEEIDMDEMQRLHDTYVPRGDTFDYNHDSDDTVKAVLQRALKAGFAQLTWDEVLVPVRDEPRTQLEQMYSPQNMRADALLSKSIRAIRPDDYDGVDIEYQSAITGTVETVECRLTPGAVATRVETIRIEGVTDETRAWRHGMRRLMWHRYIRKGYSWGTPTDALNSRLGSYCPVVGPIPSRAQSAQIEQVVVNAEGVNLLCNEALNWEGIEQHVIYWRKPDGCSAGPYEVTRGEDDYHVIAAMGSDPVPEVDPTKEPPHLIFGRVERVLVKSISPQGMSSVGVEAEGYDERLYQYDDAAPP